MRKSELADQSVAIGHKLIGQKDGKRFPLPTILLASEVLILQECVPVGYERQ
jgi:hypothetical protein